MPTRWCRSFEGAALPLLPTRETVGRDCPIRRSFKGAALPLSPICVHTVHTPNSVHSCRRFKGAALPFATYRMSGVFERPRLRRDFEGAALPCHYRVRSWEYSVG